MQSSTPSSPQSTDDIANVVLVATFIAWQSAVAKYITFGGGDDDPSLESFALSQDISAQAGKNVISLLAGKTINVAKGQSVSLNDEAGVMLGRIYAASMSNLADAIQQELKSNATTH